MPNAMENQIYKKRKQTTGIEGQFYEIKLVILFLIRGLEGVKNEIIDDFYLGSNVYCADDFDDIVFKCSKNGKVKIILLQAKHRERPEKHNFTMEKFFSDSLEKDYNLKFYLNSYLRIVESFTETDDNVLNGHSNDCKLIFFTNSKCVTTKNEKFFKEKPEDDEILNLNNDVKEGEVFKIKLTDQVYNSLRFSLDFHHLIGELVDLICCNYKIDLKKVVYKNYFVYLQENVFDRNENLLSFKSQFVDGNIDDGLRVLRDEIIKKTRKSPLLKKQLDIREKEINLEKLLSHMKSMKIEFGKGFDETSISNNYLKSEINVEDIESFIDRLHIYCNQPGEKQLDEIIKNNIKILYSTSEGDTDIIFNDVYRRTQNWWKLGNDEFHVSYLNKKDDWFAESKANISNLKLAGAGLVNFVEAKKLGLYFKDDATLKFIDVINKYRVIKITTTKEMRFFTNIKLYQTLEEMKKNQLKYIYLSGKVLKILKDVAIEAFRGTSDLLVVDFNTVSEEMKEFERSVAEIMRVCPQKKIVVIEGEQSCFSFDWCQEYGRLDDCEVKFDELNEESQKELLNREMIFQGYPVKLGAIVPRNHPIKSELLIELVNQDTVSIGFPLQNMGEVLDYHIDRTLKRKVHVRSDFLKNQQDRVAISGFSKKEFCPECSPSDRVFDFNCDSDENIASYKIFLLGSNPAEDFKKVCNICDKTTHWLAIEESKGLMWVTSHGGLGDLKKYLADDQTNCYTSSEVTKARDKIVIVAAKPGMGKTTFLSSLVYDEIDCQKPIWRGRINMLDDYEKLRNSAVGPQSSFDFVCNLLGLNTDWERHIFEHYYQNEGRIELLFDGYDEIAPTYKPNVIEMLKWLRDNSKVDKMWITSRFNVLDDLENELGSLAYKLQPFSENDQIRFLMRFWEKSFTIDDIDETKAEGIIKDFLREFSMLVRDESYEFVGVPLQLKMLAQVYGESFKERYNHGSECNKSIFGKDEFNIYHLYCKFIFKKYYEVFVTKEKMCIDHPMHASFINTGFTNFKTVHENYALLSIFDEETLLKLIGKRDVDEIKQFVGEINSGDEKTGIIDKVVDGKPKFVHRTYAEFFVALRLIRIVERDEGMERMRNFLLNLEIFHDQRYMIRYFFDFAAIEDNSGKKSVQSTFLNAVIANDLDSVSEMLSGDIKSLINCSDKAGRTALHLASFYNHFHLVNQLIKVKFEISAKDKLFKLTPLGYSDKAQNWRVSDLLLTNGANPDDMLDTIKSNDKICSVLRKAASQGLAKLAEALIKANPESLNRTDDDGWTPLHCASYYGSLEVVTILLSSKSDVFALDKCDISPLRYAIVKKRLEIVNEFIRLRPESVKEVNRMGRTPLSLATEKSSVGIVQALLNANPAMINKSDYQNLTPLHWAALKGNPKVVSSLLLSGADFLTVDNMGLSPLHMAVSKNQLDVVKRFAKLKPKSANVCDNGGKTPLFYASVLGYDEILKALIKTTHAMVNKSDKMNMTSLHWASISGQVMATSILLSSGADPNILSGKDQTPLHMAVLYKETGVIKEFLRLRPDSVNSKNAKGRSPLFYACIMGNKEIVEALIQANPSAVNACDEENCTLLHWASLKGHADVVSTLLNFDADAYAVNKYGETPLHKAVSNKKINVVNVFVKLRPKSVNTRDETLGTPLSSACKSGDEEIVKVLISADPTLVNLVDIFKNSPLHWASLAGHSNVVSILLSCEADICALNDKGHTPLHTAVLNDKLDVVKEFVRLKPKSVTMKDSRGNIPIIYAAKKCNIKIIELLKDDDPTPLNRAIATNNLDAVWEILKLKPEDANSIDKMGTTSLSFAASRGNVEIIQALIRTNSTLVNKSDKSRLTPLHWASYHGHCDVVSILLSSGADLQALDNQEYPPLHLAILNNKLDVVKQFIKFKAKSAHTLDRTGGTPLSSAAKIGNLDIVNYLIDECPSVINSCDKYKNTSLHCASSEGHARVVESLLSFDADACCLNKNGYTPLHEAILNKRVDVANILIRLRPKCVNVSCKRKMTPLSYACQLGTDEIIETIIKANPTLVNLGDVKKRTPLHWACMKGYVNVVSILLSFETDANALDSKGYTPIHQAVFNNHPEVVKEMLRLRPESVNAKDKRGKMPMFYATKKSQFEIIGALSDKSSTPLHAAVLKHNLDSMKKIIECQPQSLSAKDTKGLMPLHLAVELGDVGAVEALIRMNPSIVNDKDGSRHTPLHWASLRGHAEIVSILLSFKADPYIMDKQGHNSLHIAVLSNKLSVINEFIKSRPDSLKAVGKDGRTALSYAAFIGDVEVVKTLIDAHPSAVNVGDKRNLTPLYWASMVGHANVVSILLSLNADASIWSNRGHTPLHIAVIKNKLDVVKEFVKYKPENARAKDKREKNPLSYAAELGNVAMVEVLAKANPDEINKSDVEDMSPLHLASNCGHAGVVSILMSFGADIHAVNKDGETPLHLAISNNNLNVVHEFANSRPKCTTLKNRKGRTALSLAAEKGQINIVQAMIKANPASVNETDDDHMTPLCWASLKGHPEVVSILLDSGADANILNEFCVTPLEDEILMKQSDLAMELGRLMPENVMVKIKAGRTLLSLAAEIGNEKLVESLILANPATVNEVDEYKMTPLHWASMCGHAGVVSILLSTEADAYATDKHGETPLHKAITCNKLEVVKAFLKLRPESFNAKNKGLNALDLATRNGHAEIVKHLVAHERTCIIL